MGSFGRPAKVPGAFQPAASVLGLRASKFVNAPFRGGVSVSYNLLALLVVSIVGFQNPLRLQD